VAKLRPVLLRRWRDKLRPVGRDCVSQQSRAGGGSARQLGGPFRPGGLWHWHVLLDTCRVTRHNSYMHIETALNLAAIKHHCARTAERPAPRSTRSTSTARVILSLADGYNRIGDAELDLSVIDDVAFDGDLVHFSEALGDAGYPDLVNANWICEGANEFRALVSGRIYVAEVSA
jgi:hypothetical protein